MDQSSFCALVAYIVCGIGFLYAGRILGRRHFETTLTNPCAMFCVFYGITWFIIPVMSVASGGHLWQSDYRAETLWLSLFGFILFGVATVGTFIVFGGQRANEASDRIFRNKKNWKLEDPLVLTIVLGILVTATSVALAFLLKEMLATGITRYLSTRTSKAATANGFLIMPLQWAGVICLVVAAQQWMARRTDGPRHWSRFLMVPLALAATFVGLTQASRTRVLLPLAMLGFVGLVVLGVNGLSRRVRVFALSSVLLLAFVAFVLGAVRQIATAGTAGGLDRVSALTEAFREYENTWWLAEHQAAWTPVGGETLLAGAAFFIPRAIWDDKPTGGGPYMVNLVRPRSFVIGRQFNRSSVTNGLPSEGYLNFGFLGFAVMGIMYGLTFVGMSKLLGRCTRPFMVVVWATMSIRLIEALNMEFLGAVSNITLVAVSFIVMFGVDYVVRALRRKALAKPARALPAADAS